MIAAISDIQMVVINILAHSVCCVSITKSNPDFSTIWNIEFQIVMTVKYGKEGKQVRVSMEKEGEYVVTRVINYGRIIPKQELDHIFQKFYRTEQSRSRDTGGTGLGLAIVQQIAELHHGQVRVKSDLQGTVFEVELPVGMPKGKKEDEKR